jgi:hypothetical protein
LNGEKYITFNRCTKNKEIIQYGDVLERILDNILIKTFTGSSEDDRFLMIDNILVNSTIRQVY